MKISEYIRDLLLFHEKLVLPGLGVFQIQRKPAVFEEHRVIPPQSVIVFNTEITDDDKVLSSRIAEAEEIEPEQATKKVFDYVEKIKSAFSKGEQFIMEGFGTLLIDENSNYVFLKDDYLVIDFETTGFESFVLDPFEDEIKPEGENIEKSKKTVIPSDEYTDEEKYENDFTEIKKSNQGFLWILSGSIVVILISFIIISLTTDIFNDFDTNLFKTQKSENTREPEFIFGGEDDFDRTIESTIDSLTKLENALRITEDEKIPESAVSSVYSEFHIISGSFSVMRNANEMQMELNMKGFPSVVLNLGDGFYRVSAISFTDKEKALTELETFRRTTPYKSAWVLGLN